MTQTVTQLLKIPAAEIDPEMQLSEFGFDSISLTEFSNTLNQAYKLELTPVLFFEYPTISSFAQYLLDEHPAIFAAKVTPAKPTQTTAAPVAAPAEVSASKILRTRFQVLPVSTPQPAETPVSTESIDIKTSTPPKEFIAVIGLSGVFPGAKDAETFWHNLATGQASITAAPKARWNWDGFPKDLWRQEDKDSIRWGGFLENIENFDPGFFGIATQEAHLMDPQQRLLMMEIWKALEDAGYAKEGEVTDKQGNSTGVFIGTIGTDYDKLTESYGIPPGNHSVTGNNPALLSARVANFLNLRGPNLAVATTCSSSLVAVHLACQSILTGECELAVAGGAFIMSTAERYLFMVKGGLVSASGQCHTFDDKADGFVPGESVGVVVLKALSAAQQDGDHIYAVIKGSGVNHDGKTSALSVPNRTAQKALAVSVYAKSGVNPADITYVEAHGTASKLGDHIEFDALSEAFRQYTDKQGYCALSSVRPNIGHSVSSACISSLIKVLMGLKYKKIPPALNFSTPNEYIKLTQSPFFIPTELIEWKAAADGKRRAAVNAFALSGTNAHALLEEFCEEEGIISRELSAPLIFVLSAKNEERLRVYAYEMVNFVRQNPAVSLENMAFTLHTRRMPMEQRLAVFAANADELAAQWIGYADNRDAAECYTGNVKNGKKIYNLLLEGTTGEDFIRLAMQRRELRRLAQLWVNGATIDWNPLYEGTQARHMSLPTYPFAQQRYWVSEMSQTLTTPVQKKDLPKANLFNLSTLKPEQAQPKVTETIKPGVFNLSLQRTEPIPENANLSLSGGSNPPSQTPLQLKVQEELRNILADLLRINIQDIDPVQNFGEFGLDSIVVTEYLGRINGVYGLNVTPLALLDTPNLQSLSFYLSEEYPQALVRYYD